MTRSWSNCLFDRRLKMGMNCKFTRGDGWAPQALLRSARSGLAFPLHTAIRISVELPWPERKEVYSNFVRGSRADVNLQTPTQNRSVGTFPPHGFHPEELRNPYSRTPAWPRSSPHVAHRICRLPSNYTSRAWHVAFIKPGL